MPAAPVILPLASAFAMMPPLNPTSPPPVPFEPTLTFPPADELAIVPKFCPAKPPAETFWQELLAAQFWPFWGTLAVEVTLPLACDAAMIDPGEFNPTSPPRLALIPALLTLPVAKEDVIDAAPEPKKPFSPTSPPSKLEPPPVTLPLADEPVMVPRLVPTSPPAALKAIVKSEFPTLTLAAELDFSISPLFWATRPPASTPDCDPPLTVPLRT